MTPEVLALAADLAARRTPFVLATVVWRREPSSGKPGAAAVILPDGSVRGWLGGACAEPTVVREALSALGTGQPALLVMGPTDDRLVPEGARSVPMACASEGALEVYLEPMLPPPHVVVIGRSPAVGTLASLARALGWGATIVDDGAVGTAHPDGVPVLTVLDLSLIDGLDERTAVVVAPQGHYDEDALEAALATDAGYVGLVASRSRTAEVLRLLEDRGVPPAALERVRAPAGLDLGRVDHHEIAVAVLAELVALRAAGGLAAALVAAPPSTADARTEAIDPVCGMTVDPRTTHHRADHQGVTYYFCAAGCQQQFEADPSRYLPTSA
jgi:xanthine dehydrogenase accessory factor